MRRISEFGVIGADGKLRMPMDRVNAFFAENKKMRVIVKFEAAEPNSSELQLAYYRNYIVPTIQTALYKIGERKTQREVDCWLRGQCSACYNDDGLLLEPEEIAMSDFCDYIDWLKQFAAENLAVYVEDAKTL